MKRLASTALVAISSLYGPALALDFGHGFSITGNVELEFISKDSDRTD